MRPGTIGWIAASLVAVVCTSCIELQSAISDTPYPTWADANPPGGGGTDAGISGGGDTGETSDTLTVRVEVSSTTPQVGDEVILNCVAEGEIADGTLSYVFLPDDGPLVVDAQQGTASWIVDASDVGTDLTVQCGVSWGDETIWSGEVLVVPTE